MSGMIEWTITPEHVEWEMDWGEHFQEKYNKPRKEMIFEADKALAHLLLNEVVFINSYWWKHFEFGDLKPDGNYEMKSRKDAEWSAEDSKLISVNVNCNDVFAWGCADAERLPHDEIENLYRMWIKDPVWGSAVWCLIQRKQMPQKPVEDEIRAAGIWNLDELNLGLVT